MKIETYPIEQLSPWNTPPGSKGGAPPGSKGGAGGGQEQDSVHQDIEKKLRQRKEKSGTDSEPEKNSTIQKRQSSGPGTADLTDLETRSLQNLQPRLSWKSMMKKMFQSAGSYYDTSYTKPHRRNVSGIEIARQVGASAIKPGLKKLDQPVLKIALCFDTSGSMYSAIPQVLTEANALLKLIRKQNQPIAVVFWAGNHKWFQVNMKADTYAEVPNINQLKTPITKNAHKGVSTLLSSGGSGGTVFSDQLAADLNTLAADGWNTMIFSDTDLLVGNNFDNFFKLWNNHKNKVFYIADSLDTWRTACTQVGSTPNTWTHI